jgi:hypothetical protein
MPTPLPHPSRRALAFAALVAFVAPVLLLQSWGGDRRASADAYDPLARARASVHRTRNHEASVPAMCYTKTAGVANPCWTCHTEPVLPNQIDGGSLQEEYAFSDFALENRWTNLFVDRTRALQRTSDAEILAWIRTDNYTPFRAAVGKRTDYLGWKPDLDLVRGADHEGFAVDGTEWRALRYQPFPGTFWPTNGSSDDVWIRLPPAFRRDAAGRPSRAVYRANLAILEAALAVAPERPDGALHREIEPVDEVAAGIDFDGDGAVEGLATRVKRLPTHFVGGAADVAVRRHLYPAGIEFLHTVRYVDPDAPDLLSKRMKEVRYAVKEHDLDPWARNRVNEKELNEKEEGRPPAFRGAPELGLKNALGWRFQGFIEDARGRLRLQTEEEHKFCMGCHTSIGVTVDSTFSFPRKVPGAGGWWTQSLAGLKDVPQAGHAEPEALTYLKRVGGADEFRANDEMLKRFFPDGRLDETAVRRASAGGDRDLAWLLTPSRARALALAKAYREIVREQSFERGRDTVLAPAVNVHKKIENGDTDLAKSGKVFRDGRLWLDWP